MIDGSTLRAWGFVPGAWFKAGIAKAVEMEAAGARQEEIVAALTAMSEEAGSGVTLAGVAVSGDADDTLSATLSGVPAGWGVAASARITGRASSGSAGRRAISTCSSRQGQASRSAIRRLPLRSLTSTVRNSRAVTWPPSICVASVRAARSR